MLKSIANLAYIVVLLFSFLRAQYVMHPPPSPIFNSGNWQIIGFFIALNLFTWLAAYFMFDTFRLWMSRESNKTTSSDL